MVITVSSLNDLPRAAKEFIAAMGDRRIFTFNAPMGTGKTTFIAEVCRQLGVTETANSPSFSIVNDYALPDGGSVYHFDFYRIENEAEALDIGVEDYFYSGALCLIEWPERVQRLIPEEAVEVTMTQLPGGERSITIGESV